MWDCDGSLSTHGALCRGNDGALVCSGIEVRGDISSVVRIEKNVERGRIGEALGRRPVQSSNTIEERPHISL
jgi:hypothetical protein